MSPDDTWREVAEKVAEYLAAGAQAVWVIDPRHLTVTTHLPGRPPTTLGREETLYGESYLPGLRLAVAEFCAFE